MNEIWELAVRYKVQQKQEEFMSLLKLAKAKGVNSILEIGCFDGGTTAGFASICKKLVTCDMTLLFNPDDFKSMCNYTFIAGNSQDPDIIDKVKYAAGKVDMLFIDGDHSEHGAYSDYENYKSIVNTSGIIAFHDIVDSSHHRDHNCFVSAAWQRAKADYADDCIIEYVSQPDIWGGIGVLLV